MKKTLLVSAMIAMSMVMMFVSCKKEEPAAAPQVLKGCSCNILADDGSRQTLAWSTDEMKASFDANDCSTLASAIKYGYGYVSADCSSLY